MDDFSTSFDRAFLGDLQQGVMNYRYKGVLCNKSPLDMAIYLRILWDLKPASIIEIGYKKGGSALWFADMSQAMGLKSSILAVDLAIEAAPTHPAVRAIVGDVNRLEEALTPSVLAGLPRPWMVIEDSAHSYEGCIAALGFFAKAMEPGEILAMEDGVLSDLGMSDAYRGGPNRAIAEWLERHPDDFQVRRDYCDMFGRNATYNPNGYLEKR